MTTGSHRESREWAHFFITDGIEHLYAHFVTHSFAPHTHEGFVIGTVEAGVQTFWYRGKTHYAPPAHVIVINPDEPHTGQAALEHGWRYRTLYPPAERLAAVVEAEFGVPHAPPTFKEAVIADAELARRVRLFHRLAMTQSAGLARDEAFLGMLTLLIARYAERPFRRRATGKEHLAVRRVKGYLESHADAEVKLEHLSQLTGLSPYHLLRVFRRDVGLTPHAYQIQCRIERAKVLLGRGERPAEVAAAVGFFDQSHLGRHFKRIVGVTPGRFAKGAISS